MLNRKFWQTKLIAISKYLGLVENAPQETPFVIEEGYSLKAESLGNFLINSVPDGRGVFIFDPNSTTLPQWPFVKVAGLTSFKEDISLLYRGIDYSMQLGTENMLSLLSVPLSEDGSFDIAKTYALAYHIKGDTVYPYTLQESEKVKAGVASIKHTDFKTGERWNFDPTHVPSVPALSSPMR